MTKLLLVSLLGIAACQAIDDIRYKPKVGPLQPDAAVNGECPVIPGDTCGDSDLTVEVSFSHDIQPLIKRPTGGCMTHTMMLAPNISLDLSTYATLRKGGLISGERIIVNCRPCDSLLVHKLADPVQPAGLLRMPNNGPYWSNAEMTLLRDWIAEGARDN